MSEKQTLPQSLCEKTFFKKKKGKKTWPCFLEAQAASLAGPSASLSLVGCTV
jgi:hypothetical protein